MKKDEMTSIERVRATVKGLPVDRVPVFIWINAHTGCKLMAEYKPSKHPMRNALARFLWKRFINGGGMDASEIWRMLPLSYDVHTFNWANEYSLEFGSDFLFASHATPWKYVKYKFEDGHIRVVDWFGVKRAIGGVYPDMIDPPIKDIKDALNYRFPDTSNEKLYGMFRKCRENYPHASICAEIWGSQDFTSTSMFGTEKFMIFLVEYPDQMKRFMSKWTDFQIDILRRSVAAGADTVTIYDDYGYDNRTFISTAMWEEFTYPNLKRLVDAAHEAGALAMLHSCGYQIPLLDYYVKAEIDMLQSIQPKAGNDFGEIYEKYGDKITLVTGIDIQRGESMTPEELKAEIIENYKIGGRNGKHILATTHEIQYTMPDENMRVIFDTIAEIQKGIHDK